MSFILLLIVIVSSLISVAFYTIMERKLLGYVQIRKGPNKVGFMGLLQPFSDAIKLFTKSIIMNENMNIFFSSFFPAISLILSMMLIPFLPLSFSSIMDSKFSILSFFIISSISVYAILAIGWSANSKYCYLGAIRSVAQMISYEVSLFMIVITTAILCTSFSFCKFSYNQYNFHFIFISLILLVMWISTCLAETNRSPFDFAEGESELVSGFNVEYMGGLFALIFLAEYLSMLLLSIITVILFWGPLFLKSSMSLIILSSLILLWVRGTLPRFRFDLLMYLNWKVFLPIAIALFSVASSFLFISS